MQVHRIARAYSLLPGEVLDLDPADLALCAACVHAADSALERAELVFPVVQVGA